MWQRAFSHPPPHPLPLSHHYQFAGMKIFILSPPEREDELTWHYLSKFTSALTNCHFRNLLFFFLFQHFCFSAGEGSMLGKNKNKTSCWGFVFAKQIVNVRRVSEEEHEKTKLIPHTWCCDLNKISNCPDVCLGIPCEMQCSLWKQSGETGAPVVPDGCQFPSSLTADHKCQRASSHLRAFWKA